MGLFAGKRSCVEAFRGCDRIRLTLLIAIVALAAHLGGAGVVAGEHDIRVQSPQNPHTDAIERHMPGDVTFPHSTRPTHPPLDQIPPMPLPRVTELEEEPEDCQGITLLRSRATGETVELPPVKVDSDQQAYRRTAEWPSSPTTHDQRDHSKAFGSLSVVTAYNQTPYNRVAKLVMRFVDAGGVDRYFVCSGCLIDASIVLTSAHCLYAHEPNGVKINDWAEDVWIYPGWDGNNDPFSPSGIYNDFGYASWTHMTVSGGFIGSEAFSLDIGVVVLDRPVGMLTGWMGFESTPSCSQVSARQYTSAGYPDSEPGCNYAGRLMYRWGGSIDYCYGTVAGTNQLAVVESAGCNRRLIGGMSGGPLYYETSNGRYVSGVNTGQRSFSDGASISCFTVLPISRFDQIISTRDSEARGPAFDLVPLRARSSFSSVRAGDTVTLTHLAANATNGSRNSTFSYEVYISSDPAFSGSSAVFRKIATYSYAFSYAPMSERFPQAAVPIPADIPAGTYYLGVAYLDSTDSRPQNNWTQYWDAARISVLPPACSYTITPTSRTLSAPAQNSQVIGVSAAAGCSWTASSNASWITITGGSSGTGNGTVTYSVAANTGSSTRNGTITVAGRTHTVTQQGAPTCSYTINPPSRTLSASLQSGQTISVSSSQGCSWTASSNALWITITGGSSGNGNGTVTYSVSSNTGSSTRSGTISVAGQTHTVTQQGVPCNYTIKPSSRTVKWKGGNSRFSVSPASRQQSCSWTATTNESWISITSPSTGIGKGRISYRVEPNTSTQARFGTITVAGQTFSISQQGAPPCIYRVSPPSRTAKATGGIFRFSVSAGKHCSWTVSEDASWLHILGSTSGSGKGRIDYRVEPNPGNSPRSATITVAGQIHVVTQQAGEGCNFVLSPAARSVPAAGQSGLTVAVSAVAGCSWTASSTVPWITITSGSSGNGNGTVSYSVQQNTGSARTGTITVGGQTHTITQQGTESPRSASVIRVPGLNGTLLTMGEYDDGTVESLYVGGEFTTADALRVNHIVRWDGSAWHALGENNDVGVDGPVYDMVVHDDGSGLALYICGEFASAGGIVTNRVARWDGETWSAVGSGLDGVCHGLKLVDHGNDGGLVLYALGPQIDDDGSILGIERFARWDGRDWVLVDQAIDTTAENSRSSPPNLSYLVKWGLSDRSAHCPGDANGDGRVDINDFRILAEEFGHCRDGLRADFDGDGCVTISDFQILMSAYGTECRP